MGATSSCILANIIIDHVEQEHILSNTNPHRKHIGHWCRYVDDILCLWSGTLEDLRLFNDYLNNLLPSLHFTTEIEVDRRLNFLDVAIDASSTFFAFSIYRKPTTCSALIPADSCHYIGHKLAAFKSMVQRMLKIPLNEGERIAETNTILKLAKLNGYGDKMIRKIITQEENKLHPLYIKEPQPAGVVWRSFSYHHHDVAKIGRTMNRWGIKCGFKTNNSIYSLLKERPANNNILSKTGVYKIKCDDCEAFYLGETGRDIGTRVREHRRYKTRSAFGKHLLNSGHKSVDDDNIEILHVMPKGLRLTLTEAYEIWKEASNNNLLNEQVELRFEPLFKACE